MPTTKPSASHRLKDLVSVGPATLADLARLGVRSVEQLARQDARTLYERLSELDGRRADPCVEDVFRAAIAQARDPRLPRAQRNWWYWSRVRKGERRPQGARARA